MRLFIAVNINSRSKKLIAKKLEILKTELNSDIKWVEKDKWHLTLKFIGEVSTEKKEKLIEALKNINFSEQNKYIQFNKVDAFPSLNTAKVIYLALNKGRDVLKDLHGRLEKELLKYGFESDQRPYIPHLTLGRNKNESLSIKKELDKNHFVNIYAQIKSISLYKSELRADGSEYFELFSIK